ncbi:MAG: M23 family metallopeptidase [Spirochaetota bacterium]|nr:M23 family metallopeptidase [Spirochaetota bacterium]
MDLNPFKDSNLNDLQLFLKSILKRYFGPITYNIHNWITTMLRKGRECITILFIPHSEKKIISFHIRIYTIIFIISLLTIIITITSTVIVNHASTTKGVSKLKMYGANSKDNIKKFKEEINKLYDKFQEFKPRIACLYSLAPNNNASSLWAKGGGSPVTPKIEDDDMAPPMEILNIEEMKHELKTIKEVMKKVKDFLGSQKKIIENTPSIWPVDGYIVMKYGEKTVPHSFRMRPHNGIDIAAFPGSKIYATAPGKVGDIKWDPKFGLIISIKHKYGFYTYYSHCQKVIVEPGQKISKGDVIGYVGKTGEAERHLCFYQVKIGTKFVNPLPYLNRLNQ